MNFFVSDMNVVNKKSRNQKVKKLKMNTTKQTVACDYDVSYEYLKENNFINFVGRTPEDMEYILNLIVSKSAVLGIEWTVHKSKYLGSMDCTMLLKKPYKMEDLQFKK